MFAEPNVLETEFAKTEAAGAGTASVANLARNEFAFTTAPTEFAYPEIASAKLGTTGSRANRRSCAQRLQSRCRTLWRS